MNDETAQLIVELLHNIKEQIDTMQAEIDELQTTQLEQLEHQISQSHTHKETE